jgi:hypothetical protein
MTSLEFRLHIGAHKTATTHLQNILAANKAYLLEHGIFYVPRIVIRQTGLVKIVNENYSTAGQTLSWGQLIRAPNEDVKCCVLSEENIIGGCADLLEFLYQNVERRLLPWSHLANNRNTKLYIAIRDYANILISAYSQALRDGSKIPLFSAHLKTWLSDKPSWCALINKIRSSFAETEITVWTFERYIADYARVASSVCGLTLPRTDIAIPEKTKSLSADAIRRIENISPSADWKTRMQMIQEIGETDKSSEKFDPLSVGEKSELQGRYLNDVENINKMDVKLLR